MQKGYFMVNSKEIIYSKNLEDIKYDLKNIVKKKSVYEIKNIRFLQNTNYTDKNHNLSIIANNNTQIELKEKEDTKASSSEEFLKEKKDNNKENKAEGTIVNSNSQAFSTISQNQLNKASGNSQPNLSENSNNTNMATIKDAENNDGESLKFNLKDSNITHNSENTEQNSTLKTKENSDDKKIESDKKPENKENQQPKSELDKIAEAYKSYNKSDNIASNNKSDASSVQKNSLDDNGIKEKDQSGNQEEIQKTKDNDEWEEEDSIARSAFAITICFFIVFIALFVYNLIKCYRKNPPQEKPIDVTHYSRELQNQTLDEDAVLDLSTN